MWKTLWCFSSWEIYALRLSLVNSREEVIERDIILHFMQNYKYIYTNAAGGLHQKSIFLKFIYFENRAVIINLVARVRVSPFPVSLDKGNTHSGN